MTSCLLPWAQLFKTNVINVTDTLKFQTYYVQNTTFFFCRKNVRNFSSANFSAKYIAAIDFASSL